MRLHNSIRVDGSIFIAHGKRILWSRYLPEWAVIAYCTVAEWFEK